MQQEGRRSKKEEEGGGGTHAVDRISVSTFCILHHISDPIRDYGHAQNKRDRCWSIFPSVSVIIRRQIEIEIEIETDAALEHRKKNRGED
jgi:hypothetical protein